MRLVPVLMVSAMIVTASVPALAQQLYTQSGSGVPIYNSGANPLPMEQMIAGKNAPSYNYNSNKVQPYNLGGTGSMSSGAGAPLTPDQVAQMRANRNAQAQQYEQHYLQQAQNQLQGVTAPDGYAAQGYNALYGGQQQQQQQRPTKKRLLYKQGEDMMPTPPRLFNID